MPDIIKLLPDSVANQIAAGEVIQRPASVVKELLENSIDSGADDIKLIIKDAGKTSIQVIDNGRGMSDTDARLSFERHATSKIKNANDLFAIRSLGFRGEALASIAAIAHVELKTKKQDQELGTAIEINGSTFIDQSPCSCQKGTSFTIKNLFYNVPARRNFLKSNAAETRHIYDEFFRVVLTYPNISFSLYNNTKQIYQLNKAILKQRIVNLMGNNYNQRLIPVEQKTDIISIKGFICKPEFAKKTRGEQFFFVNKRFIKNSYLNHAVVNAFKELIPENTLPSYFIYFDIDPTKIDINIHPTKTEINFQDNQVIYSILKAAIRQSIGKYSLTPTMDFDLDKSLDFPEPNSKTIIIPPKVSVNPDFNPFDNNNNNNNLSHKNKSGNGNRERLNNENWSKLYDDFSVKKHSPENEQTSIKQDENSAKNENIKSDSNEDIFQLHNQYIVTKTKSGIIIIDQQKAHERILYEEFLKKSDNDENIVQNKLFCEEIKFPLFDFNLINDLLDDLNLLGFDISISEKKENTIIVNGAPNSASNSDLKKLIEDILENFKLNKTDLNINKKINLAFSMAKNLSSKKGVKLHLEEMENIIDRLFACEAPYSSPEGSPTLIKFSVEEIEKKFNA